MRRWIVLALSIFVVLTPLSAQGSSNQVDEQLYELPMPTKEAGWLGAFVDDSISFKFSSLIIASDRETIKNGKGFPCYDLKSADCLKQERISFNVYLPPCSATLTTDCIVSLSAIKPDGTVLNGKLLGTKPNLSEPTFRGDKAKNFPDGWFPSLWSFDGVKHEGGESFMLRASIMGFQQPIENPQDNFQLRIGLNAVSFEPTLERGSWTRETLNFPDGDKNGMINLGGAEGPDCRFFLAIRECASSWALPNDYRFKVIVKVTAKTSGWINGRLSDPTLSMTRDSDGSYRYTIEAAPMQVPVYGVWTRFNNLSREFQEYVTQQGGKAGRVTFPDPWRAVYSGSGPKPFDKISSFHNLSNYNEADFKEFLYFVKETTDTAVATKSLWHLETNQNYVQAGSLKIRECTPKADGIAGVVTTNSTMFLSTPPQFDEKNQTLDYKVAAPHFDKNGKPNVGSYNLVIDSKVARCLYSFSDAPINASVSIVNTDGTQQIATNVVSEKNGWLSLSANGYNYSAPTVRVKLTQQSSSQPSSSDSASQASTTALPPILINPKVVTKITAKMGDVIVFTVEKPTTWSAKIANKKVVAFVKGRRESTYVTNPGLKLLKPGKSVVTLTSGKLSYTIPITVTP
ncbi:MAG: hypothetical protein FJW51_00940 [Actinobacteria bacterium]|nr:hypothetical protein [Actinomycetota bacterium]